MELRGWNYEGISDLHLYTKFLDLSHSYSLSSLCYHDQSLNTRPTSNLSSPGSEVANPSHQRQARFPACEDNPKIALAHFKSNAKLKTRSWRFRLSKIVLRLKFNSGTSSVIASI